MQGNLEKVDSQSRSTTMGLDHGVTTLLHLSSAFGCVLIFFALHEAINMFGSMVKLNIALLKHSFTWTRNLYALKMHSRRPTGVEMAAY